MIKFQKGLSINTIKAISAYKQEDHFFLNLRLNAYKTFLKLKNPKWGPDLSLIDFSSYIYFSILSNDQKKWKDVPTQIKKQFKKLHIPNHEAKYLSGVHNQFDSGGIYSNLLNELQTKKVIFCSMEDAIIKYPKIVKKYLSKLVPISDNKYAALNTAVFSGGSFLYVPKNVIIDKPVQAYFRINSKSLGQFERTLIVCEEGAQVHYMEGCTAPTYDANNLHAAVVEVFVKKNAHCQYSTIQNWSNNVLNLVTKRAYVEKDGYMEWLDGNIGSKLNMKYPCSILAGENACAKCISIATCNRGMIQDTGAKMIHLAKNTKSYIQSRSIANSKANATYRGLVQIYRNATNSYSEVECDSILLANDAKSDVYPTEIIDNDSSFIKHEAKTTMLDLEKSFFLATRGFDQKSIKHILVMGFVAPFTNNLPIEYAVELNRLIKAYF